jgi:hypothetical protein
VFKKIEKKRNEIAPLINTIIDLATKKTKLLIW